MADILASRGTRVVPVYTPAAALATVRDGATTIVVTSPSLLTSSELSSLAAAPASLLVVGPNPAALSALAPPVTAAGHYGLLPVQPACALPAARLAGNADVGGLSMRLTAGVAGVACYPVRGAAFLTSYFEPVQQIGRLGVKPLLIENKHIDLTAARSAPAWGPRQPGPPWRIGWFGCLRCRKSLNILTALAARRPDLVEVVIRGRQAPAVFDDFADIVAGVPGMLYGGPYHPREIGALYRDCHFSWAIDYYDEGRNSAILIPNRIYDAGAHHCVPLALAGVETGRWLARRRVGVLLEDPLRELEAIFERLDAPGYRVLEARMASVDPKAFRADRAVALRPCRWPRRLCAHFLPSLPISRPRPRARRR